MRTVLIVEDDFDTLHPLAELLRLKHYKVSTAAEAEQGFTVARRQQPDLIITDIALPGKSGLQFIGAVRGDEQLKSTPIIVISGCGPMILVEAEAAGATCCLEKPISIDRFWAAIDEVFAASPESEPFHLVRLCKVGSDDITLLCGRQFMPERHAADLSSS